jgi:hypothetical protein
MTDRCFTTQLGAGQALTLAATRSARRLVVTQGRLWVTLTGGTEDHWLSVGDGLTLPAGAQAVAEAEAWPQAAFQLLQPAVPRPARRAASARLPVFKFGVITS